MHMSWDQQTITPEGSAKHFWNMHHKTNGMETRYGNHDTEDIHDTQDSPSLDLVPQDRPMLERDNDSSDEYCEETDTCSPLADLLEQFQQRRNQFASLKSNTPQSTPTEGLSQLTDKLQHLTIVLQPVLQSSKEPVHKTMQAYKDTLCTAQRESNLTMTVLQDIPIFDGQDSSKLEDWFMDIETTTDILTEIHTCLAKSHSLTVTLICKATQIGKCWDEINGILKLKLHNANIHT